MARLSVFGKFRVCDGLNDAAAAVMDEHGVCVVERFASYGDCSAHLAVVERLYGALPRPALHSSWPPPSGWLHNTLLPQQRLWLTSAGLHVAALDRHRHNVAAHLLEGPGCHLGRAWAWRAAAHEWFEKYHGEPCVASIEPVWVQIPKLHTAPQAKSSTRAKKKNNPNPPPVPFPVGEFGTDDTLNPDVPVMMGCAFGERPDAGPPVQPHYAQCEPPWSGLSPDGSGSGDYEKDLATLTALAWSHCRERPVRALLCVSSFGEFCLAAVTEKDISIPLALVQGDLLLFDPARWRAVNTTAHCHPSDRLPGSAKPFVWQPVGSHPVRLEPNSMEERATCVKTGRRPRLSPDGHDYYPLARDVSALAPLTGDDMAPDDAASESGRHKNGRDGSVKAEDLPHAGTITTSPSGPNRLEQAKKEVELDENERHRWEIDGVVAQTTIDRNPVQWKLVLSGSKVVPHYDNDGTLLYIVENAGVMSVAFSEAQLKQSMDAARIFGPAAPTPVAVERGKKRTVPKSDPDDQQSEDSLLVCGSSPAHRMLSKAARASDKLEEVAGPLDPAMLGWAETADDGAWAGTANDVLMRPETSKCLGLRLAPLRWGPRALGCRPWLQAVCRLNFQAAQRHRVATEVTQSLCDAFELCARGTTKVLPSDQPLPTLQPLWKNAGVCRFDGPTGFAAAALCPWGLPVAVLAGCPAVAADLARRLAVADSSCLTVWVDQGQGQAAQALNDCEQLVRAHLETVPRDVRRCAASVVLVLPPVAVPATLLSPDCGPVMALAVLLTWIDPWLQAQLAHRLAAWSLAGVAQCLAPNPAPFRTLAAPSQSVLDHLRVTRVQLWQQEDRGGTAQARKAALLVRQLRAKRPPSTRAGRNHGLNDGGFALLPSTRPFHTAPTRLTFPLVDSEISRKTQTRAKKSDVTQAGRARDHTADGQDTAGAEMDAQADQCRVAPWAQGKRRRRTVDPVRYSKEKRMRDLVDRFAAESARVQ